MTYKANVEKIIVENDQAVGVRLVDGSEHFADIVVSVADGYNTIFKLFGVILLRLAKKYEDLI